MAATLFFFSSRRRHTRLVSDWSSDVCSSDLLPGRQRRDRRDRLGDPAVLRRLHARPALGRRQALHLPVRRQGSRPARAAARRRLRRRDLGGNRRDLARAERPLLGTAHGRDGRAAEGRDVLHRRLGGPPTGRRGPCPGRRRRGVVALDASAPPANAAVSAVAGRDARSSYRGRLAPGDRDACYRYRLGRPVGRGPRIRPSMRPWKGRAAARARSTPAKRALAHSLLCVGAAGSGSSYRTTQPCRGALLARSAVPHSGHCVSMRATGWMLTWRCVAARLTNLCGAPAGTTTMSPALASIVLSPTVKSTSPSSTMNVSSYGCRCSFGPVTGLLWLRKKDTCAPCSWPLKVDTFSTARELVDPGHVAVSVAGRSSLGSGAEDRLLVLGEAGAQVAAAALQASQL